jgi:hypothetical protein
MVRRARRRRLGSGARRTVSFRDRRQGVVLRLSCSNGEWHHAMTCWRRRTVGGGQHRRALWWAQWWRRHYGVEVVVLNACAWAVTGGPAWGALWRRRRRVWLGDQGAAPGQQRPNRGRRGRAMPQQAAWLQNRGGGATDGWAPLQCRVARSNSIWIQTLNEFKWNSNPFNFDQSKKDLTRLQFF